MIIGVLIVMILTMLMELTVLLVIPANALFF